MEIRHLCAFLQIASTQSFTQAASILGYSQSNISMQIRQLEQDVGVPLFDRIDRQVSLTQYGRDLLPYAQQIVSMVGQIENLWKAEHVMDGIVRIGMVESLFETIFVPTINRYHLRFPNVKVELIVDGTESLKERLRKGQIDIACLIDSSLSAIEWNCWYMRDVAVSVIASPSHPLAAKSSISPHELAEEDFILMEESASYTVLFLQFMRNCGICLTPFLKLQSPGAACRLVESGHYLSVLPNYVIQPEMIQNALCILPVSDFYLSQQAQVVLHKNKAITPQIQGFLEEMQASFLPDIFGSVS